MFFLFLNVILSDLHSKKFCHMLERKVFSSGNFISPSNSDVETLKFIEKLKISQYR